MATVHPSLRHIASELGISPAYPAYLSYMVNEKRPWRKALYQRYVGVVNSEGPSVNKQRETPPMKVACHVQFVPDIFWRECEGVEPTYPARHEA